MRDDLGSPKALLSPCDPRSNRNNQLEVRDGKLSGWCRSRIGPTATARYKVSTRAQTYGIHLGGDNQGKSILATTCNILGGNSRDGYNAGRTKVMTGGRLSASTGL